jgi:hypothetical protein
MALADLGLLIPPTRMTASLIWIGFLPGYVLSQRLKIWRDPFFALVGAMGLSFLISPFLVLPGYIFLQKLTPLLVALSLNLFCLVILFQRKSGERLLYDQKDYVPILPPLLIAICLWVFIYLGITRMGPFTDDWIYLSGIVQELVRHFPPRNPEASFLPLRQPWGFWFMYALIHCLGGVSTWRVFEILPGLLSFVYLGLIYMIAQKITRDGWSGVGAILFLTFGGFMGWILKGLSGNEFIPEYGLIWEYLIAITGYSLLWGWYTLPGLIPVLTAFYFLIRYHEDKRKQDLILSLVACSIGPFFHPVYILGFLGGLGLFLLFQFFRRRIHPPYLIYYLTPLPFLVTFYLYFQPDAPQAPIYIFHRDWESIGNALKGILSTQGLALPFVLLALVFSGPARQWLLPFFLFYFTLSLVGTGGLNHPCHFLLPNSMVIALLGGIGLSTLKTLSLKYRALVFLIMGAILLPPYINEVAYRIETGWEGTFTQEQRAAGNFIRTFTPPRSIFVVLPDNREALETVEGLGERVVVYGISWHLDRYENEKNLANWREEATQFFSSPDPATREDFIKRYQVHYILIGPNESQFMEEHHLDLALFKQSFIPVYANPEITILKTGLVP